MSFEIITAPSDDRIVEGTKRKLSFLELDDFESFEQFYDPPKKEDFWRWVRDDFKPPNADFEYWIRSKKVSLIRAKKILKNIASPYKVEDHMLEILKEHELKNLNCRDGVHVCAVAPRGDDLNCRTHVEEKCFRTYVEPKVVIRRACYIKNNYVNLNDPTTDIHWIGEMNTVVDKKDVTDLVLPDSIDDLDESSVFKFFCEMCAVKVTKTFDGEFVFERASLSFEMSLLGHKLLMSVSDFDFYKTLYNTEEMNMFNAPFSFHDFYIGIMSSKTQEQLEQTKDEGPFTPLDFFLLKDMMMYFKKLETSNANWTPWENDAPTVLDEGGKLVAPAKDPKLLATLRTHDFRKGHALIPHHFTMRCGLERMPKDDINLDTELFVTNKNLKDTFEKQKKTFFEQNNKKFRGQGLTKFDQLWSRSKRYDSHIITPLHAILLDTLRNGEKIWKVSSLSSDRGYTLAKDLLESSNVRYARVFIRDPEEAPGNFYLYRNAEGSIIRQAA